MEIKGLHVAIVHRRFALGGAEEVSRQTACLFSDLGIHTHFFAETHIETEWTLPDDPLIDLSLLPQGDAPLDKGKCPLPGSCLQGERGEGADHPYRSAQ